MNTGPSWFSGGARAFLLWVCAGTACAQGVVAEVGAVVPSDEGDDGAREHPRAGDDAGGSRQETNASLDATPEAGPDALESQGDLPSHDADQDAADRAASALTGEAGSAGQTAAIDAGGTPCTLVVNELMTGRTGAASDEFIELYNPCGVPLDVGNWKIVYRAGSNTSPPLASFDPLVLVAWAPGTQVPAGGILVFTGTAFVGPRDGALNGGMKDGSGSVGIRDAAGHLVDSLGYGSGTIDNANAFIEAHAAPANDVTTRGASVGRLHGRDTNDNRADFTTTNAPTPGRSNP